MRGGSNRRFGYDVWWDVGSSVAVLQAADMLAEEELDPASFSDATVAAAVRYANSEKRRKEESNAGADVRTAATLTVPLSL